MSEHERSGDVSDYEMDWWGSCARTLQEEQKQLVYAARMGLVAQWGVGHPPVFDLEGRSVIDIGGGPVSLLLKCGNRGRAVVADPAEWPVWVLGRYEAEGIEYWRMPGEVITGYTLDEAWIYNVLQHVGDPSLVIARARELASTIRIFEWIDIPPYPGHPHMLTQKGLEGWLGAPGFATQINESGASGRAFYGVFST